MVTLIEIQKLADQIARLYQPDRIILFGSHAYGDPKTESDVDLLVIMNFAGRSIDLSTKMWSDTRPDFPVDLIVRKPDDTVRRYKEFDPLIREALDKGKVLYERNRARVAG